MNRKSSYLNIEFLSACTEARLYPEDFGHEVAICGRSNSGKSSIINALANSKKLAKTSNTPGRTQSINFFCLFHCPIYHGLVQQSRLTSPV